MIAGGAKRAVPRCVSGCVWVLRGGWCGRISVDGVHELALDDAVGGAGAGLVAAEDGVDEVVVGEHGFAGDDGVLDLFLSFPDAEVGAVPEGRTRFLPSSKA